MKIKDAKLNKLKDTIFEVLRDYDMEKVSKKNCGESWELEFSKFYKRINKNPKKEMLRRLFVIYSHPECVDVNYQLEVDKVIFQVLTHDWDSKNKS